MRNSGPLGPYCRPMPRALWKPWFGGLFLMGEVPLYALSRHILLAFMHISLQLTDLARVAKRKAVSQRQPGVHHHPEKYENSDEEGGSDVASLCRRTGMDETASRHDGVGR